MSIDVRHRFPMAVNGFGRLDAHMDSLFGQLFGEGAQAHRSTRPEAGPLATSLWTEDDQIHMEVDLPGVAMNDLEVSIHGDVLTIRAERKAAEGRKYAYNSRNFGRFERSITLPESVDGESIDARLSNGVLHLSIRKRPEDQPRKIEVRQD